MNLPIKTDTEIVPVNGEKAAPLLSQSDVLKSLLGGLKFRVADHSFDNCAQAGLPFLGCSLRNNNRTEIDDILRRELVSELHGRRRALN